MRTRGLGYVGGYKGRCLPRRGASPWGRPENLNRGLGTDLEGEAIGKVGEHGALPQIILDGPGR